MTSYNTPICTNNHHDVLPPGHLFSLTSCCHMWQHNLLLRSCGTFLVIAMAKFSFLLYILHIIRKLPRSIVRRRIATCDMIQQDRINRHVQHVQSFISARAVVAVRLEPFLRYHTFMCPGTKSGRPLAVQPDDPLKFGWFPGGCLRNSQDVGLLVNIGWCIPRR